MYFDDVKLQLDCKLWAEEYNRYNPPKKIDVVQMNVLQVCFAIFCRHFRFFQLKNSFFLRFLLFLLYNFVSYSHAFQILDLPGEPYFHLEHFIEGDYIKYNSNSGFVSDVHRKTPQAFSHFTFERSGHQMIVVDIQVCYIYFYSP